MLLLLGVVVCLTLAHPHWQKPRPQSHKPRSLTFERYQKARSDLIRDEHMRGIGATLYLNAKERRLNNYIMDLKEAAIAEGLKDPTTYLVAQHFYDVVGKINQTELYRIIRNMPKGGALHLHSSAMSSLDFFMEVTYWDHLWMTYDPVKKIPYFKFGYKSPGADWFLVKDERARVGKAKFDKDLRWTVTLYTDNPLTVDRDLNTVWRHFDDMFDMTDGIFKYVEVWRAYVRRVLEEFEEDNVNYLEVRSTLGSLYDLNGNSLNTSVRANIMLDVMREYQKTHPKFMGMKVIYSPVRFADNARFATYMDTCKKLQAEFPGFVVGFDLVGQEDRGYPLIGFAEKMLQMNPDFKLFMHAGETNWNGVTDDNLVDAVLLGTERIGHGYAITKHPQLLELTKQLDIAIEVQPISNQVLRLVGDIRNHPATTLFSDNYPVVISSDDPTFWESKPLSHDFYYAFMGLASARQDLRLLKQLAYNSLKYSASSLREKRRYKKMWLQQWDQFVDSELKRLRI